jgi:hypothetical protein
MGQQQDAQAEREQHGTEERAREVMPRSHAHGQGSPERGTNHQEGERERETKEEEEEEEEEERDRDKERVSDEWGKCDSSNGTQEHEHKYLRKRYFSIVRLSVFRRFDGGVRGVARAQERAQESSRESSRELKR